MKQRDLKDYHAVWGTDGVVVLPPPAGDDLRAAPSGPLVVDAGPLFTTRLTGTVSLFSQVTLMVDDTPLGRFAVIGALPDTPDVLFGVLEPTGAVVVIDMSAPEVAFVNSSLTAFTEFLYLVSVAGAAMPGTPQQLPQAVVDGLHDVFAVADPAAVADPDAWWPRLLAGDTAISSPGGGWPRPAGSSWRPG